MFQRTLLPGVVQTVGGPELYGFLCGSAIGLVAGLVLGLKNRRDILDASDDLLGQIEELKG